MKKLYWLICKNRDSFHAISLPLPIHHERSPSRLLWPTDGKPRNFLCPECNHAYEYILQEVQSGIDDKQPPSEEVRDEIFRIEARCGEANCGLPVYILLTAPSDTQSLTLANAWFETATHGVVRCSAGHLTRRIQAGSIDVRRDESFWT